ncbi:16S rRNA (guanine(527)-N(7))-methyltransferase RsmG [Chloroflexota bacterium]
MELLHDLAKNMAIDISKRQLEMFEVYYRELVVWNNSVNLTAITDYEDVQIKHFLDSITLVPYLKHNQKIKVIDIGSGGGFPGVPIKILNPDIELALLEATAKKTSFLNHLIGSLQLKETEVICGRAEEKASDPMFREIYDIALTRAVGALTTNLELSLPFCRIGGLSVSYKKVGIEEELENAKQISSALGGRFESIKLVSTDIFPDGRILVFFRKISPTPSKYPRRSGLPSKRPL